ncbi:MAG: DUF6067 family protein, partial [Kiritimatiellae bacterium]|nr:DUF6067 family protein [Kiritimatiellia bacterium]
MRAQITNAGKVVAEDIQPRIDLPPVPEWWGNDLGKVEALRIVPAPWTAIQISEVGGQKVEIGDPGLCGEPLGSSTVIRVWGREIGLDDALMPVRITHREVPMTGAPKQPAEMLAAPVTLRLSADGPMTVGPARIVTSEPWQLTCHAAVTGKTVTGTLTLDVEFDGFMKYTLGLQPLNGTTAALDELTLEIPVPRAHATHYNHGFCGTVPGHEKRYDAGILTERGLTLPFTEKLWVGNPTLGLDFVCERDHGWSPLDNPEAVRVRMASDQAVISIRMVASRRTLAEPARYQWALLATPAKPMNEEMNHGLFLAQSGASFDPVTKTFDGGQVGQDTKRLVDAGGNALNLWAYGWDQPPAVNASLWNPNFAAPSLNPAKPLNDTRSRLLRDYIRICHEAGMRWVMLYMLWHAPCDWPNQYRTLWTEMLAGPRSPSQGGYLFEPGAAFNDWYLWELDRSIRELDIDGLYQDSSAHRELTANPYTGTGWYDDRGRLRGSYPVFATRELHKRIWMLFHAQHRKNSIVYSHNTHLICPVVESFVDVHHCGEGSALRDPNVWVGKFYGYPCGLPVSFTRWNNPIYPEKRIHSWRTALLLDVLIKAVPAYVLPNAYAEDDRGREFYGRGYENDSIIVAKIWDAWRAFPWKGSLWLAPWDVGGIVRTERPDIQASLHLNRGRAALLTIANSSSNNVRTRVEVDWAAMGFEANAVTIVDVITPQDPIAIERDALTLEILDWRWRLLHMEPKPSRRKP